MSTLDPEFEALLGTTVVGKYRIDELIGRGGMGAVFRATNVAIGKRVALKFLYRDATRDRDAVSRFQREAEAASSVESAHIVEIFDSGITDDGLPFLVMELLKGEDLRARLRREGRLSVRDAVHVGAQIARALRRAHEAGIVHRDLKPDNVFLCARDDDPMFVKLVDFGISKVTHKAASLDTLTRKGLVLGTAFYMSPEQAQALPDVDGRTDLFSLGAILFEALTGHPPHTGRAYEAVLIAICTQDAPDVRDLAPEVPEALARVIAVALRRDRDERHQSASALYADLAAAVPGLASTGGQVVSEPVLPVQVGERSLPPSGAAETAESAAVHPVPASVSGPRARRAVVTALVTTLVAFTATVLVMGGRGRPDAEGAAAEQLTAPVTAPRTETAPPTPRNSATSDAPAGPSAASTLTTAPATSDRPPPPGPSAVPGGPVRPLVKAGGEKPQGTAQPSAGGVVKGLELATEP